MTRTKTAGLAAILLLGCEGTMESSGGGDRDDGGSLGADSGGDDANAGGGTDAGRSGGADAGTSGGTDAGTAGGPDAGGSTERVFEEIGGLVAVEAEHFAENDDNGTPRAWHVTSASMTPGITPDPDEPHVDGASGGAYVEGLPDTRVTHDDPLVNGESFFNTAGAGPTLTYRVYFNTPGTYYVWGRALTTGTEDNGAHVGIDDDWPSTGTRMQWCGSRGSWLWRNAQRDSGGSACGVDGTITIDVAAAGEHRVRISMREDGFELDKIVLTTDADFTPMGEGPEEAVYSP